VSAGPDPRVDNRVIEQERRRLGQRLDEVGRMCEADVPVTTFYGEMLKRLLESLAAPAGAVWVRTTQGNLQLQFQVNVKEVGIDRSDEARQSHEELLRAAVAQPKPFHLLPHSGFGPAEEGRPAPGNPTDYIMLVVPILLNGQVSGLLEVWQSAHRPSQAIPGFLQYMGLMADLAARYQRNQMLGQMTGQQQLWTQLEAFARQIHGSLNPIESAYIIANEGRRLVECDRVSVAVRYGKRTVIESISGADVVERRSNLVQLMKRLCDRVIVWGEKLVFTGVKDDSLPPDVLAALDAYLAESPSKMLMVLPLHDEREGKEGSKEPRKTGRSALLMECFDPTAEAQQMVARLEVIGRHSAPALYNAVEHRRIPMRWVWMPMAKLQEGLGGKGKTIATLVFVALTLLVSILILVPYPLKMDSTGQLVPVARRQQFVSTEGYVKEFYVHPGDRVPEGRVLALMFDRQLQKEVAALTQEIENARREKEEYANREGQGNDRKEKGHWGLEKEKQEGLRKSKELELQLLCDRTNAIRDNPGYFYLRAPQFDATERNLLTQSRREWTILDNSFEGLKNREVKPSEPIMHLGANDGPWEIELKIPQKHIGQVLHAFERLDTNVLDVDFLVRSDTTRTFKGKLYRDKIGGMANPQRDDNNESEPVVFAYVSIDDDQIDPADRLPRELLRSGIEVHGKVRCGNHRMGYSLFYGVWEFLYEKVVFFF
jgi:hypothetical protein